MGSFLLCECALLRRLVGLFEACMESIEGAVAARSRCEFGRRDSIIVSDLLCACGGRGSRARLGFACCKRGGTTLERIRHGAHSGSGGGVATRFSSSACTSASASASIPIAIATRAFLCPKQARK
jgi:hypothetical protein